MRRTPTRLVHPTGLAFLTATAAGVVALLLSAPFAGLAAATEEPAATPDAAAQEADADQAAQDALVLAGSQVYTDNCSGCHQARGAGISGQFPPLLGNPRTSDPEYLRTTIANGKQGEIEVLGVTYDGRMPAFSTLADTDVDALVAYITGGFVTPTSSVVDLPDSPVADGSLPLLANYSYLVALAIAGGVALLVMGPRIVSSHDRLAMPWLDASLKSALIVVGFIVFTVLVPAWAMRTDTVTELPTLVQDLIGTGLWISGLAAGIWALWFAQRESRI